MSAARVDSFALFDLGFRLFFLLAGLYGFVSMAFWSLEFIPALPALGLAMDWHAHEMIYGYAVAVIAGFLLTAIRNWTGLETVSGAGLGVLGLLWLLARVAHLIGRFDLALAMDALFMLAFCYCALSPIIRVRQWRQMGIALILVVLLIANCLYYAGQLGWIPNGAAIGNYVGFYLVIGLILAMTGRVLPMFTANGVDETVTLSNHPTLEKANALCYLLFFASMVCSFFFVLPGLVFTVLAGLLALINGVRIFRWFSPGIFSKPLLWSLFLAYLFLVLGFLLKAIEPYSGLNPYITIHAFGAGGIGIVTLSMMMRVSLGHSGRNVRSPPVIVGYIALLMGVAAIVRVVLPIFWPASYLTWIVMSQVAWMLAFLMFCWTYAPMLVMARIDGKPV